MCLIIPGYIDYYIILDVFFLLLKYLFAREINEFFMSENLSENVDKIFKLLFIYFG